MCGDTAANSQRKGVPNSWSGNSEAARTEAFAVTGNRQQFKVRRTQGTRWSVMFQGWIEVGRLGSRCGFVGDAILNLMRHSTGSQCNCLSKPTEFIDLCLEPQTTTIERQRSAHVEDGRRFFLMISQAEQSWRSHYSQVLSRRVHRLRTSPYKYTVRRPRPYILRSK